MTEQYRIYHPLKGICVRTDTLEEAEKRAEALGPGAVIRNQNGAEVIFCGAGGHGGK